jgi:hypothetical protein
MQRKHDSLFMKLDGYQNENQTTQAYHSTTLSSSSSSNIHKHFSASEDAEEDRSVRLKLEQQVAELQRSLKEAKARSLQQSSSTSTFQVTDLETRLKEKSVALESALYSLDEAEVMNWR